MTDEGVKRLGMILSIQAEIEAMKVENLERERNQLAMAYTEDDFQQKANSLEYYVRCDF